MSNWSSDRFMDGDIVIDVKKNYKGLSEVCNHEIPDFNNGSKDIQMNEVS